MIKDVKFIESDGGWSREYRVYAEGELVKSCVEPVKLTKIVRDKGKEIEKKLSKSEVNKIKSKITKDIEKDNKDLVDFHTLKIKRRKAEKERMRRIKEEIRKKELEYEKKGGKQNVSNKNN